MLTAIAKRNTGQGKRRRHSRARESTRIRPKPNQSGSVATSLYWSKPWLPNWASENHSTTAVMTTSTSRSRRLLARPSTGMASAYGGPPRIETHHGGSRIPPREEGDVHPGGRLRGQRPVLPSPLGHTLNG